MPHLGVNPSRYGLDKHGIENLNQVFWNLGTAALIENAIRRREGLLATGGPLVVKTGVRTGRSPHAKFVVRDETTENEVVWGPVNQPFTPEKFERVLGRLLAYLQSGDLFVQDCFVGADPQYRLPIRVITEYAWHNLFARQLFIRADHTKTTEHVPEFTVIDCPKFHADPDIDGTRSEAFVLVNFAKKMVIIGGTGYAGEMKKSVFTIMNYLLPKKGVLPMHCSANIGPSGDCALFFGLSGTGKTTLSADPNRRLIGDDEHGWSDNGIFNFEGGCYAKCIHLSPETEPQIYNAVRFGTVLENVNIKSDTRVLDFDDDSLTENTRSAYPLRFIEDSVIPSIGGHPENVVFLTCDAFGVLPPISKLTAEQAMYHFQSGYTAKVAGTEAGVKEPSATFSTCFGAPFLPLSPTIYAKLLGERIARHNARIWLVNTGWTGGPYGVGSRMKLPYTRTIVQAALNGSLDGVQYKPDPIFGVLVPQACPDVPTEVLIPRNTWKDKDAYDAKAKDLAQRFQKNFEKYKDAPERVRAAGPKV